MRPIKFKGHNIVYAKDQPQYNQLPGLKLETIEGEFISCWKFNIFERIQILFTGRIWFCLWTFNKPLTPMKIALKKKTLIPKQK